MSGHTRNVPAGGESSKSDAGREQRRQTARSAATAAATSSADPPKPQPKLLPWANRFSSELAQDAMEHAADPESSRYRRYLRKDAGVGAEIIDGEIDGDMAVLTMVDGNGERLVWRLPRGSVPLTYTGPPGLAGSHEHPQQMGVTADGGPGPIAGAESAPSEAHLMAEIEQPNSPEIAPGYAINDQQPDPHDTRFTGDIPDDGPQPLM